MLRGERAQRSVLRALLKRLKIQLLALIKEYRFLAVCICSGLLVQATP